MAKVIISGAGGMIGLALIKHLISEGDEVTALVRPGSKSLQSHIDSSNIPSSKIKITECALDDYAGFCPTEKADIFFHLAWDKTSVAGRDDAVVQATNIGYSLDAVSLAHRYGCSAFVGAGSQAEFGITDVPLNQSVPVNPQSCYGVAKYSAGRLTRALCKELGIRHCWTRILSIFGENDGAGTLIMYLIRTLLSGETPQLTRCEQIWDYMYCGDAAAALSAIGKKGRDGTVYCLGNGKGRQLFEYVNDVVAYINENARVDFGAKDYYPHQPMHLVADISDLTAHTGFVPSTPFSEGIARTVEWCRANQSAAKK